MCGIAGWVDWRRDLTRESRIVEAMGATLARRGPDAGGIWLSAHAGLAHRRLTVVDPCGGAQPMVRRCGDREYVIIYNGELYNTEDIRRDLVARGYSFSGYSDTEVLLTAFIEWGPACLERLNGIFAFGIWSETDQTLFLARDRMGVKPLFYAERDGGLIFGSELKALLANPAVRPELDATGIAEVFLIGPARTPGCGVFRGVTELRAGQCLTFSRAGLALRRYWQLVSQPHTDDLETTAATVGALLADTVERQLVSDVPLCTLLSGGLDSSAITAFATAARRRAGYPPVETFSIDYAGNDVNFHPTALQPDADGPWVKRVSDFLGTTHHSVIIGEAELAEAVLTSLRASDLPDMADVSASLLLFCGQIKRHATVGVSGEAADEIFGGYPWCRDPAAISANTFPWARSLGLREQVLAPGLRAALRPSEYIAARYDQALAEVPRLPGETGEAARMREIGYLNVSRFMPTLLDRKDRMSMANGLEVRVPFCDHRLVEYVWNIPWDMKTVDGREKGILRRALRGVLPDDVVYRRKSPYPKTHSPTYAALMRGRLRERLADPASPLRELVDVPAVTAILDADGSGIGLSWFGQLMGAPQLYAYLVQVDAWIREYGIQLV